MGTSSGSAMAIAEGRPPSTGISPSGPGLSLSLPLLTLAILLVLTGVAGWATHIVVRNQERQLLRERTREVGLVLTTSTGTIPPELQALGTILRSTGGSASSYRQAATVQADASASPVEFAMVRTAGGRDRVGAVAGSGVRPGQYLGGAAAQAIRAAERSGKMVSTGVMGSGSQRSLGFAIAAPSAPPGVAVYRQSELGALSAPREAVTAPFHEVRVVLYASPGVRAGQVLVSTTNDLPLRGSVDTIPVVVGASRWLLAVDAVRPLVGSVVSAAAWIVLVVGALGSVLIAAVVASESRRRQVAVALYAGEHDLAESLQRSLLPTLPRLPGLDLAARYLAGDAGQEVGGDWFDVFAIAGDRVGIVIGDVIGHDLLAATAMSQIRATLRAFAWKGDPPEDVLDQLDSLVDAFGLTQLVTVFYGVLGPLGEDGSRILSYANAGHLPPLVLRPDGAVRSLTSGTSIVIGAPRIGPRRQAKEVLSSGSTLLLFTDGLVEVPGEAIDVSLDRLADLVAGHATGDASPDGLMSGGESLMAGGPSRTSGGANLTSRGADELCQYVVTASEREGRTDDIAVLAVRLQPGLHPRPVAAPSGLPGSEVSVAQATPDFSRTWTPQAEPRPMT